MYRIRESELDQGIVYKWLPRHPACLAPQQQLSHGKRCQGASGPTVANASVGLTAVAGYIQRFRGCSRDGYTRDR